MLSSFAIEHMGVAPLVLLEGRSHYKFAVFELGRTVLVEERGRLPRPGGGRGFRQAVWVVRGGIQAGGLGRVRGRMAGADGAPSAAVSAITPSDWC